MKTKLQIIEYTRSIRDHKQMMYTCVDNIQIALKSPTKSHSRVICASSTHCPRIVCMRLQFPDYFKLKSRTALLKIAQLLLALPIWTFPVIEIESSNKEQVMCDIHNLIILKTTISFLFMGKHITQSHNERVRLTA